MVAYLVKIFPAFSRTQLFVRFSQELLCGVFHESREFDDDCQEDHQKMFGDGSRPLGVTLEWKIMMKEFTWMLLFLSCKTVCNIGICQDFGLKMEEICFSETLLSTHKSTQR
jgi:hypothetical protein